MRVERLLADAARHWPDKVALVAGDRRLTYRELDDTANRVARALQRHGVQPADRVVVFLDNSIETVASVFAVLKAGAVFTLINPVTRAKKLAYVIANCGAAALVTAARLMPVASEALQQCPSVRVTLVVDGDETAAGQLFWQQAIAAERSEPLGPLGIDVDLTTILYTSGSTGVPKGVMLTHRNLMTAVDSVCDYLDNRHDDVLLTVLPLSFGYGLNQILTSCKVGATVVLEKSFAFPFVVVQKMRQEGVTGFALVPTIAAILLQMKDLSAATLPALRYITSAAAAMPPAHSKRLRELFPDVKLYLMYGQTECTRICFLPPEQVDARPTSVGKAIPNTECYIVDEAGARVGPGVAGELVVRGGHVMAGYWNDAAATAQALRPGLLPGERVLYTNDLIRTDDDGYLYFVARRDDIIKTRGEKVSPLEIEHALYQLPAVREAAVIGVPDPIFGQAIKAVLALHDGMALSAKEVQKHCAALLEDVMVPKHVEFRAELPKTASGKISRAGLQAEAE